MGLIKGHKYARTSGLLTINFQMNGHVQTDRFCGLLRCWVRRLVNRATAQEPCPPWKPRRDRFRQSNLAQGGAPCPNMNAKASEASDHSKCASRSSRTSLPASWLARLVLINQVQSHRRVRLFASAIAIAFATTVSLWSSASAESYSNKLRQVPALSPRSWGASLAWATDPFRYKHSRHGLDPVQ
jgi:hypothetical protein